ncbi:OprD family porin [Pseudomonas helleri]|uniref:Outer membrane porin, OprD family n=1 Tax=Pseudomonas helleri TaxID=1608996 RepID=A0A7X1Y586_9PSED|nr:OprD family porin [Pseudomonas helleri]MQT94956.1 outer membrane porin, OprD family [Pseudomonas helleri]MQU30817.1 outer membrane porin, OprD family [Pseudomonas helleri]
MRRLFMRGGIVSAGLLVGLSPELLAQGFFEDSQGKLTLRNYYFNDGYRDGGEDRKEWAQGFLLNLQSGYTEGTVGFGLDALGLAGLKLDSSPTHAGTGLLPVHDDGHAADDFSSLGITAKMRIGEAVIKTGNLMPKIPVLVYNDGRLLPQTFRGTQIEYTGIRDLYLHSGHLDKFKQRNSTDSVDIYPQGYTGSKGTDFDFAGATYKFTPNLSGSWYYGEMREFYRQQFFGLVHKQPVGSGSLTSDLRYFISDDAGEARSGAVDADMLSGLFTYRLGGHALGLGYQKVSGDTALPYTSVSTVYSFSNAGVGKFIQAGEQTWMLRYDYDFAAFVPGLSLMTRYYKGENGDYKGREAREWESDTNLRYVIQSSAFKGVGIEVRKATYRSTYASDRDNYRLYLTYDIALW